MQKKTFLIKLLPARTDFAQTMTDNEKSIMQQHIAYWKDFMRKGVMLLFGPVLDPNGTYGIGIISVNNDEEVKSLLNNDPASAINTYEYYPILAVLPEHV